MKRRLYIRATSSKGRGVFCTRRIPAGQEFEVCPLLVLTPDDYRVIGACRLNDYIFNVNEKEGLKGLSLGFGSLYNHATNANAAYYMDSSKQHMIYFAVKDIPRGTEICINYTGEPGKEATDWFSSRGLVPR
jgi:hypothetical protein